MSIFKTSWVILRINKIKENEEIATIFTESYWKLNLKLKKSKKEKSIDLGYIVNFEINVRKENSINEIKNIKIKNEFEYNKKSYGIILEYLEILNLIEKNSPLNMNINWIFEIISKINLYNNINIEKLLFSKAKLLNIFWILKSENSNENIKKVLSFIEKNHIDNILKLSWLRDFELDILKKLLKD
jgi:hypothetical protein